MERTCRKGAVTWFGAFEPLRNGFIRKYERSYCVIAAQSCDGIIGVHGRLPWKIPYDWSHFARTTSGGVLISGRKSFEETGVLKGRQHVVLSSQDVQRRALESAASVRAAENVGDALRLAEGLCGNSKEREIFICGGENVYRDMLPRASRLVLTTLSNIRLDDGSSESLSRFPSSWRDRFTPETLKQRRSVHVSDFDIFAPSSSPLPQSLCVMIEEFEVCEM